MLIFRTRIWAESFASACAPPQLGSLSHFTDQGSKGLHPGPSQPVLGLKDPTPSFSSTPLHPAPSWHRKKADGKWPDETGPTG